MGQKVNPIGFRIGITENWRSRWYAKKRDFSVYLLEDQKIRKHIRSYKFVVTGKHEGSSSSIQGRSIIPRIEIERTSDKLNVIIYTPKPGVIIGKKGQTVDYLRADLEKFMTNRHRSKTDGKDGEKKREINLEIKEITRPEVNAQMVAENIAEQIVRRANTRRAMQKAMKSAIDAKALGIKIIIGGRLAGAEMARVEKAVFGKVPLQSLNAHIQYGAAEAYTTYGSIGIKVWIYIGKYGEETVNDGTNAQKA